MEGPRRYKGDNYNQEVPRTTSYGRKPPVGNGRPATVPLWEKDFCSSVCKIPWSKILDAKKFMSHHKNVVKWDDSAGEEAFHNARSRFYASMHGLPCDIPMPDPNLFIDEIDWDCKIDPELILDLDCEKVGPRDRKCENILILGDTLLRDQGFSGMGWGDCENDLKEAPHSSHVNNDDIWKYNGWENFGNDSWVWYDNNGRPMVGYGWGDEGWGNNVWVDGWGTTSGWGDGWNNSWGWYDEYGSNYGPEYAQQPNRVYTYGTWNIENGNREGGPGDYISGHGTQRFHSDDYQRNGSSWNANSAIKMKKIVPAQPMRNEKTASRGKRLNSCAPPFNHQASGKAGNWWSMEKPVSKMGSEIAMYVVPNFGRSR